MFPKVHKRISSGIRRSFNTRKSIARRVGIGLIRTCVGPSRNQTSPAAFFCGFAWSTALKEEIFEVHLDRLRRRSSRVREVQEKELSLVGTPVCSIAQLVYWAAVHGKFIFTK